MSEIKNVGYIWMVLNTSKYNHLMPLHFKGLTNALRAEKQCYMYENYLTVSRVLGLPTLSLDRALMTL